MTDVDPSRSPEEFPSTRWSRVFAAGRAGNDDARAALAELCAAYWFPLYAFIRRRGYNPDEAADLTQGFFAAVIERGSLASALPERGRFRTFLQSCCRNYVADRRRHASRIRRGGGRPIQSFEPAVAEDRYRQQACDPAARSPEELFDRDWALAVLDRSLARLRAQYASAGKSELFVRLLPALGGDPHTHPHAAIALALGMSEGAVNVAAHRMRRLYGELIRAEVAAVCAPEEVDNEIRDLFIALRR